MQFFVRAFLLAILAFEAVPVGATAPCPTKEQKIAVKKEQALSRLRELGASISFDFQWSKEGAYIPNARLPGDPRLRKLLGKHYAAKPVKIQLYVGESMKPEKFTDDDAKLLAPFTKVKWLVLSDTKLTDAGLMHLVGICALERLDLEGTLITEKGIKKFKALRPKVQLFYEP